MESKKGFIWITTEKEAFHKYPGAPEEVSFLRNTHRHIFKFKVYISVDHNDRDIEFIMFKHFVEKILHDMGNDLNYNSCEMLSDYLYVEISKEYGGRDIRIEVSEDGENGVDMHYTT